jgi:predicted Fe-Mo cluster-binding NifX family protein
VDPRFGRCQYFIVVDPETMRFEAVENTNVMASGGAGIGTAQMVANKGVGVVLTGNCGPNAHQALAAAGVQVITGVAGRVRDAIEGYKTRRYQAASQPSVSAHFGMGPGMGKGRGLRLMPMASLAPQPPGSGQDVEALKQRTCALRQQLEYVKRRLRSLERKA